MLLNCNTKSIEAPKNHAKKTARYYEQDAEKVNEYLEKIKDIPKGKIIKK